MSDFNAELDVQSDKPLFASNYIPASTVQVHASNLLQLPNGDLLCAWFGGSQEGLSDICIHLSRLKKGSRVWSTPQKISDDPERSEQNPVLFLVPGTAALWVMYTAQPAGNQDKAVVRYRVSSDEGQTWSLAHNLFNDEGLFIRQPVTVLKDGTWVLPAWYCRNPPGFRWVGSDDISVVKYTRDGGKTWQEKGVPNSIGAVHMNIKALRDGSYIAFYRSRWADNIYMSTSTNCIDWTEPKPTSLPNPNSGICFEVLSDDRLIMIYNDSQFEKGQAKREGLYDDITPKDDKRVNQRGSTKDAVWGVPRKIMTVGVSSDGGRTWKSKTLQEGDGFCMTNNSRTKENRELSYPSIWVERGDKDVVNVAFTFWRQRIKFIRFDVDWLNS
ncbi:glycoside hydrolase family 33 protein [Bipolaris maydis ATCC 48331]|uniref:Glycoside hydrolase family 33 protein n=2 Tax=Cochliobolus heterostrophus TaxID=5016 RepID=M2T7X7_COCH5|nr:glycoside hydrolase family 33 protein [Bipolaris maydis ATCC 48331]EMD93690.1 glycoside hydrolase family 33 protein [Bipolaris maydis C5]KAH7562586.1 glycoside hydrolase family 33 protein [Bipolaris maydis]ENH99264.1 glycoside hydrolase family 33 protein [Bipolaris maydis ATCC 48331]KAJ5027980.1 glycoside hydrolase [Bipolaris maydis]KAJ5062749.1 glycosyl hydrolase [Bipolaris maydis]